MDPNNPILRRFPLVARPRPIAKALTARVDDLCALAERAERANDLAAASAVYNQAALIASDCGQPDLARQRCHEHAEAYLPTLPWGAQAARHALEPLVNLARLHIRDGDGDAALQLLTDLFHAVSTWTDTSVDGYPLPASRLTWSDDDHREVRRWLWGVLIADGARALTSAGRWQEAYEHLKRHNGIGQRMLDGRQVAVIAHATTGEIERARTIVSETACGELWEQAITACLGYLCAQATPARPSDHLGVMLESYLRLTPTQSFALFHTRLGLSIIEATDRVDHPDVRSLAAGLTNQALTFEDAYVARELLRYGDVVDALHITKLVKILEAAGFASTSFSLGSDQRLLRALAMSRDMIGSEAARANTPPQGQRH
ncbi:hypothetical protein AB0873_18475 [Micromonospora sp. NPDC047707]|uniref:hypothetical protein n=1 Tax=Micromonospora sp. NPDC047707 TaxID=3154498 RepID=UPI00345501F9